jgi:type IV secretion system protein VirB3
MARHIEGFEVPIHRSLIEPILIAGLPRAVALVLWTTTAALVMGMRQIWFLALALAIHVPLGILTKKDPYFLLLFFPALRAPEKWEL